MGMDYIGNHAVLLGTRGEFTVVPYKVETPAVIYVKGNDLLLNVAFALIWLGYPKDMLAEFGYEVEAPYKDSPAAEDSSRHYIGPYFRWEISGFWASVVEEISIGISVINNGYLTRILNTLDIEGLVQRDPTTLSGGETAKVVLAAHLVRHPRYLVLDRVLGELDESSRHLLLDNLKLVLPEAIIIIIDEAISPECDFTLLTDSNKAVWYNGLHPTHQTAISLNISDGPLVAEVFNISSCNSNSKVVLNDYSVLRSAKQVFPQLCCTAAPGDFVLLSGANGSGKTSFIEGLGGLLDVDGRITVDGIDVNGNSKAFFALSPQDPQCDITELNLYHELRLACDDPERIDQLVEDLGMPKSFLEASLKDDIGLQKLTSVLSATLRRKPCCLLDEPSLYLSREFRLFAQRAIRLYLRQGGIVFCSSHDRKFIAAILGEK
jgi:energy-coupling factor transport system ATP-binding protein